MATDKQWRDVKALADDIVTYSCILELRDRIEALEREAANPNHPAKPDSSLVDRVAISLAQPGSRTWDEMAAAAIRAVAAWLGTECEGHLGSGLHWAIRLEQEATR